MKTGTLSVRSIVVIGLALPAIGIVAGCERILAGANAPKYAEKQYREGLREEMRGDLGEAEDCYEDALDFDPNHPLVLRRLGQVKTKFGEYDTALRLFKRAVHVTGGDAAAYNDLAYCQELSGDPDAAEQSYRQGIKSDPTDARLRTNLGLLLARQGRTTEAMRSLRAAPMSEEDAQKHIARVQQVQRKKPTDGGFGPVSQAPQD